MKATVDIDELAAQLKARMRRVTDPDGASPLNAFYGLCSPACETCGGSGWLRVDVPPGHMYFGKLILCPNVKDRRVRGHFGLRWNEQEKFNWGILKPYNNALEAAAKVQATIERGAGWVFLYGSYGRGKSYILKIAVAEAVRAGKSAVFADMTDIMDDLKTSFDARNPSASYNEKMAQWRDVPLLAIDEIDKAGAVMKTEDAAYSWAQEQVFKLFNWRYDSATYGESVTLIGSNVPVSALPGYLQSRINDNRFERITLTGKDIRLGMEWEG